MTMELYDAVNGDGLFDVLDAAFDVLESLNTARLTTIQDEVEGFVAQFKAIDSPPLDMENAMVGLPAAVANWKSTGNVLTQAIATSCQRLLIEFVQADGSQPNRTLGYALEYLIDQMETAGDYVDPNTVSISLSTGASNVGDPAICYTTLRGDGRPQENLLAEVMELSVARTGTAPSIRFTGKERASGLLREDWPAGSGASTQITATQASASLLSNGNFETTTIAHLPDDWIVRRGTPGEDIWVTKPEIQTVRISGTPSGGVYVLMWQNEAGVTRATATLAYNASGDSVAAALSALPGLESVTVESTGTSPNYTHTIVFGGIAGNLNRLTSVNNLTGGVNPAIHHDTVYHGDDGAYIGRALRLIGDGASTPCLYHPLTLRSDTVYFCHFRIRRGTDEEQSSSASSESSSSSASSSSGSSSTSESSASSLSSTSQSSPSSSPSSDLNSSSSSYVYAEELRVSIVDGIDGNVTQDGEGNDNEIIINSAAVSEVAHESKFFTFRITGAVVQPVYLRIEVTKPIASGKSVYLDEMAVVAGNQVYTGGPYVAVFAGATACVEDDEWTLTTTNDRAGNLQEWFNRVFAMADKGLLLPTSGAGTHIPDSVESSSST